MGDPDRAQAYTLEGVFAAVIMLSAMLYGLQIVDIGPWTSDAADRTSQLKTRAMDTLDLAASNGTLSRSVRCYGVTGKYEFDGGVAEPGRATALERLLNASFDERGNEYNLYFYYWNTSGGQERVIASRQTNRGGDVAAPSDAAAVATRKVAVYDDMPTRIAGAGGRACGSRYQSLERFNRTSPSFYMPDMAPDSPLYNVVEVRLVVW